VIFSIRLYSAFVLFAGLAPFAWADFATAEPASFMGLGDIPGGVFGSFATDVSADGSVVVGKGNIGVNSSEAFRWTASTGMIGLGNVPSPVSSFSVATGVSANGQSVSGVGSEIIQSKAAKWIAGSGMIDLGSPTPLQSARAEAISGDGQVIVGAHDLGGVDAGYALRWSQGQGYTLLSPLPTGSKSNAFDVTGDGSVIVGWADAVFAQVIVTPRPTMWINPQTPINLGDLPGGSPNGKAFGISASGLVAVGYSSSEPGFQAFRWTSQTGMVGLGDLPGSSFNSTAIDVSADGSIIVGHSQATSGRELFIWDALNGMRSMKTVLETDYELDLTGWILDGPSVAISDDGSTIVGGGRYQNVQQAFRAYLPEPSMIGFLGLLIPILCFRRRKASL
jgi:probable HAF family extracellular repeat protein